MTLVKFSDGSKGNALSPVLSPLFNDVFESFFNTDSFVSDRMTSRVPAVNIAETDSKYLIELAVPGMKKEDFKIGLDKNMLSISAENSVENSDPDTSKKYNRREYSYSSFVRTFTLPESADYNSIGAEYSEGILKINVGKKEEDKFQSREIAIQ